MSFCLTNGWLYCGVAKTDKTECLGQWPLEISRHDRCKTRLHTNNCSDYRRRWNSLVLYLYQKLSRKNLQWLHSTNKYFMHSYSLIKLGLCSTTTTTATTTKRTPLHQSHLLTKTTKYELILGWRKPPNKSAMDSFFSYVTFSSAAPENHSDL